jgi:hypothetical protein
MPDKSYQYCRHDHVLKAPKNWDPRPNGRCVALAVRVEGIAFSSAWEPTPAELEVLKAGGNVLLTVFGGQPPVILAVEPSDPQ